MPIPRPARTAGGPAELVCGHHVRHVEVRLISALRSGRPNLDRSRLAIDAGSDSADQALPYEGKNGNPGRLPRISTKNFPFFREALPDRLFERHARLRPPTDLLDGHRCGNGEVNRAPRLPALGAIYRAPRRTARLRGLAVGLTMPAAFGVIGPAFWQSGGGREWAQGPVPRLPQSPSDNGLRVLSGRDGSDSRRVLKPDLDAPCGPRPPAGRIAVGACDTKPT